MFLIINDVLILNLLHCSVVKILSLLQIPFALLSLHLKTYPSYLKLCLLHTAMEMKIKNTKDMDPELSERLQDDNFYDNIIQNINKK